MSALNITPFSLTKLVFAVGITISRKEIQPSNKPDIELRALGIVTEVRLKQFINACLPIVVTLAGITNAPVIPVCLNAVSPIVSSKEPSSKVTDVSFLQLLNADFAIVFTDAGIIIEVIGVPEKSDSPIS